MKRSLFGLAAACVIVVSLAFSVASSDAAPGPSETKGPSAVKRGAFLVKTGGCNDCHTPWKMGKNGLPEPDMTRMLSGHPEGMKLPPPPQAAGPWIWFGAATNTAYAGPWGISYAPNLTPDPNTGLGSAWTEEIFVKAIKTGKHFGTSRLIMPPMPWEAYSNYSDADLKAMYAYLKTIPPIVNHVPDSVEAPPPAPPGASPKKK